MIENKLNVEKYLKHELLDLLNFKNCTIEEDEETVRQTRDHSAFIRPSIETQKRERLNSSFFQCTEKI